VRRAVLLLISLVLTGFAAPSAQAATRWFDGNVSRSQITNCASIIINQPRTEDGAWNWVGFFSDENNAPDAGQVFYVHTVFAAVGNACSGQRGYPEISLPAGVDLAISAQTPVFCWAIDFEQNTAAQETVACPQQGYQAFYGGQYAFPAENQDPQYAGTWPLPQGKGWELQIPVVSSRQLRGILASPCDCVYGFTKILDGESSPVLTPNAGLVAEPASAGGGGGPVTPGGGGGTTPSTGGGGGGTNTGGGGGTTNTGGGGGATTPAAPVTTAPPPAALTGVLAPRTLRLGKLLRAGAFSVTVGVGRAGSKVVAILTGAPRGDRVSAARRVVLAKATRTNVAAGNAKVKLRLTRAGKRALRRVKRGRVRLRVTVTPPGAAAQSKTSTLSLRR
jgi:hypothetical protein